MWEEPYGIGLPVSSGISNYYTPKQENIPEDLLKKIEKLNNLVDKRGQSLTQMALDNLDFSPEELKMIYNIIL